MPYTRQLLVAALGSALAFVLFLMCTYVLPDISPLSEPNAFEVASVAFVILGLLVSAVMAFAFTVSFIMWRLNGGEPEPVAMPLGKRLKGAAFLFVLAMLAYGSFFLFG